MQFKGKIAWQQENKGTVTSAAAMALQHRAISGHDRRMGAAGEAQEGRRCSPELGGGCCSVGEP